MPIPTLLIGPSLLPLTIGNTATSLDSGGWPDLLAATEQSLERLTAQRTALLSSQLPRIVQLWVAAGAQHAQETFDETLGLLNSPPWPSSRDKGLSSDMLRSGANGASNQHPATEYVRLSAIKSAADEGVRKLAHARLRLSTIARRLELRTREGREFLAAERRAFESAARLAAAAAAAARHPLLAEDGGVDRRYSSALRQLPG
jgi:hypothetical protein